MVKIKKGYNLIVLGMAFIIMINTISFFTGVLYACYSKGMLRLPIGSEGNDTYGRMEKELTRELLEKLSPHKEQIDLMSSLGINRGDKVVEVGGAAIFLLAFLF